MSFHSGPLNDTDQLVAMVSELKFQQTKFRAGYDQCDVDDFLDLLIDVIKDGKRGDEMTQLVDGAVEYPKRSLLKRMFGRD
ncbi:DivIVA domain-containing protein [Bowdeniella massiliensis]|uniref:DivIVA domain-containing protein n=1 Tax=Bowdeniella massiliensis TaxID=2932264 RepID=UPI0020283F15|nr:DivIVA domain-containing protein [Bowdeniella massiliensis]